MTNSTKYQIMSALVPFVSVFVAGSYVQTFLSDAGVPLSTISSFTSAVSAVQILVMIINIFAIDRIKNVKAFLLTLIVGSLLGSVALIPICIGNASGSAIFWSVVGISLVVNVFMGLYNVFGFRVAYHVIDMSKYASVTNNVSIINGILAIIIGIIISQMAFIYDFKYVMTGGLVVCALFCIISTAMAAAMKYNAKTETPENHSGKFSFSLLKRHEFTYFYIPNFMRGLAMSAINVMPLIFMKSITKDSGMVSMLVNIMSVSLIAGCTFYKVVLKRMRTVTVYFLTSVAMFVFMPALLIGYNVWAFYIFYFFLGFFYNINAVAASVYPSEIVEYENIGTYTSVRLIILVLGQAVGAYVIGLVIDSVSSLAILSVCALLQLASGIAFMKFKK